MGASLYLNLNLVTKKIHFYLKSQSLSIHFSHV